ncbi:MAG: hypothetical protein CMP11_03350 [Zetaproteobacteria bacterium]|nr:hypothetical protein [Pseudobdellovibrionaceae bacterium]
MIRILFSALTFIFFSLNLYSEENKTFECSICACETTKNTTLQCKYGNHEFCTKCIYIWFLENDTCPTCRHTHRLQRIIVQLESPIHQIKINAYEKLREYIQKNPLHKNVLRKRNIFPILLNQLKKNNGDYYAVILIGDLASSNQANKNLIRQLDIIPYLIENLYGTSFDMKETSLLSLSEILNANDENIELFLQLDALHKVKKISNSKNTRLSYPSKKLLRIIDMYNKKLKQEKIKSERNKVQSKKTKEENHPNTSNPKVKKEKMRYRVKKFFLRKIFRRKS